MPSLFLRSEFAPHWEFSELRQAVGNTGSEPIEKDKQLGVQTIATCGCDAVKGEKWRQIGVLS